MSTPYDRSRTVRSREKSVTLDMLGRAKRMVIETENTTVIEGCWVQAGDREAAASS
jgi:hypothetical protein